MITKLILILGGYRSMGLPIAQFLLSQTDVSLTLAGRSLEKAQCAAEKLNSGQGRSRVKALSADASDSQSLRSYVGVDLMPEQITLAQKRGLDGAQFIVSDATNLSQIPSASIDTVVIFGVLHHIPPW